jgi:type VI secretion system protein ImpL
LKKALFIAFILFLALFLGIVALILAMFQGWSPWVAVIPPSVILGGPLLYYAIKAFLGYLSRRRYAKSVLNKEKQTKVSQLDSPFSLLKQQWQHGLMALKPPLFSGPKDPIMDLPWFLLLGPHSSHKPQAMVESGLFNTFRFQGSELDQNQSGKEGCDWYFFENSVYLDVKGLFIDTKDPSLIAQAHGEWKLFLELLLATGRKNPLDGLVLTIPVSLMDKTKEDSLRTLAISICDRIDAYIKKVDQMPPVYLLITGMDQIPSLSEGLHHLDSAGLATGLLLEPNTIPDSRTAALIIEFLISQLAECFLQSIQKDNPHFLSPLLAAPSYINSLERPLAIFLNIIGHISHSSPPLLLRGVFFSANSPVSEPNEPDIDANFGPLASPTLGPIAAVDKPKGLIRSLGDLFGRILPQNRALTIKLNLPSGRRQKMMLLGLSLYYLFLLFLALTLYQEVRFNRNVSQTAQATISQLNVGTAPLNLTTQTNNTDLLLDALAAFETDRIKHPLWTSRADQYIDSLKADFDKDIDTLNKQVIMHLKNQLTEYPDHAKQEFSITLNQILWIFSVFNAYLSGTNYDQLAYSFPILPPDFKGSSIKSWNITYNKLIFSYLNRQPRKKQVTDTLADIKGTLSQALRLTSHQNLDWLVSWAHYLPDISSVTLTEFWQQFSPNFNLTPLIGPTDISEVPAAYTIAGRTAILNNLDLLHQAYANDPELGIDDLIKDFRGPYDQDYQNSWRMFAKSFLNVSAKLPWFANYDETHYLPSGSSGTSGQYASPYSKILTLLYNNLKPFLGTDKAPDWLKNIELDNAVVTWSEIQKKYAKKPAPLNSIETYSEAMANFKKYMPSYYFRSDFIRRIYSAAPHLEEFQKQQSTILAIIQGQPDPALQLAATHFGGPGFGDASQSPFTLAKTAINEYTSLMFQDGSTQIEDITVSLRLAILKSLEDLLIKSAASRLDELWNTEVVSAVQFLSPEDTNKALYGQGGLILKFQQNRAAAFINKRNNEYAARQWEHRSFPFTYDFLRLLTVGNVAFETPPLDSYNVTVTSVATLVDSEASEKPERTTITLKSSDSVQTMDNFNYPTSNIFVWKPATGGDTELTIAFPSLELYVTWSSKNAFPTFVSEI